MERGIRARVSSFARHHVNAKMTKGKTCGDYVNSILAKREALLDGYDEAILLDSQGLVAEASGENVFVVRGGELRTPPLADRARGHHARLGDRDRARQGHPGARGGRSRATSSTWPTRCS